MSKCIERTNYVIDTIMKAKCQKNVNEVDTEALEAFLTMPKGFCLKHELSEQDLELLELSEEISKNILEENSTMQELLKNCPDSVKYLMDKCLIKPVPCQYQGEVFFDFFLFEGNKQTTVKVRTIF